MASARLALVAVALCVALFAGSDCAQLGGRILGGEETTMTIYPFAVSVRLDGAHICGGSIISSKHILTAAHTLGGIIPSRVTIRVGSTNQFAGGKIISTASITIHPDYTELSHDIAILTLATPLVWTDKIGSIPLATAEDEEPPVDAAVTVAGWGEQTGGGAPFKLQFTTLTVSSEAACTDAFIGNDASTICLAHALKQGSCHGDAGNGAIYNGRLVAVSNYVIGACGARYPDVFANVAYYADWINSVAATSEL